MQWYTPLYPDSRARICAQPVTMLASGPPRIWMEMAWSSLGRKIVSPSTVSNCQEMLGAGKPRASQSRVRLAPLGPYVSFKKIC